MDKDVDLALARLAQAQHQVVSRQQALAVGLTSRALGRRLASGRLERLIDGVYALPGAPASLRRDVMAACLRLGPWCVASHETAAALHGLGFVGPAPGTVVTVPFTGAARCAIAHVHRSRHLGLDDVTAVDGIPVTTVARTLIDLAMVIRPIRLERAVDDALATRAVRLPDLEAAFDRVGRGGRRGRAATGRILLRRSAGAEVPDSVLEARLLALVRRAGVPAPDVQWRAAWLPVADGRVDLAWPAARLVVEGDGRRWHSRDADWEQDQRRDNAATLEGWRVLRFTWTMLTRSPDSVTAALRQALAPARRHDGGRGRGRTAAVAPRTQPTAA